MPIPIISGALLGLSVAAPFGPVSLVCVQRTLSGGLRGGIASGFGAATAHGAFALLAILGTGLVADTLAAWHHPIRLASAALLIGLGLRILARRGRANAAAQPGGARAAYLSALLLALSNPMTILPYLAIASAAVAEGSPRIAGFIWVVPGVMLGATAWYGVLSAATSLLRRRIGALIVARLNGAAGACLIGFGVVVGIG